MMRGVLTRRVAIHCRSSSEGRAPDTKEKTCESEQHQGHEASGSATDGCPMAAMPRSISFASERPKAPPQLAEAR
jgi:hypothetical protein